MARSNPGIMRWPAAFIATKIHRKDGTQMKRVLSIQDISCVGKCSLTVALPILSVMGVEACPLPTAVLSTHTAFEHFTFRDLTDEIQPIAKVWEKEKITFDAVGSGYLGSLRQIALVEELGEYFRKVYAGAGHFLQIVDPAMADNGALYTGFTPDFAKAMASLCIKADLILPNLTEACLMTGKEYWPDGDESYWEEILAALADMGCQNVVLTGYSVRADGIGAIALQTTGGGRKVHAYMNEKLPGSYHGTGDIFASVVTGAMAKGKSLEQAQKLAVDFTLESMRKTMEDSERRFYGVNFEEALATLGGV